MADRPRPPLTGFNHNVRYRERIFHIQTEDSGLNKPHVFSHVFIIGAIVSSSRFIYTDIVEQTGHEVELIRRMQLQHKTIMAGLLRGKFDDTIRKTLRRLEEGWRSENNRLGVLESKVERSNRTLTVVTRYFTSVATDVFVGDATVIRLRHDALGMSKSELENVAKKQHCDVLRRLDSGGLDYEISGVSS